jgi:hypothetical protein
LPLTGDIVVEKKPSSSASGAGDRPGEKRGLRLTGGRRWCAVVCGRAGLGRAGGDGGEGGFGRRLPRPAKSVPAARALRRSVRARRGPGIRDDAAESELRGVVGSRGAVPRAPGDTFYGSEARLEAKRSMGTVLETWTGEGLAGGGG